MAALPDALMPVPVGRERLPREVMEEHQRERVLRAAVDVFAELGYQATTVDDLVAASKTGVGSFYALFGGKEDCFLRCYALVVAEGRERLVAALDPAAPWPEQLIAALHELLALVAEQPRQARIVLVEAQTAGRAAEARYAATFEEGAAALRRGRSFGGEGDLPEMLEDANLAGLLWSLHQRLAMSELDGLEVLLPEFADILLSPYVGEAESTRLLTTPRDSGKRG